MKKILFISLSMILVSIGCVRERVVIQEPYANFSVSTIEVFVDEDVVFTNSSTYTHSVSWDFDDGRVSHAWDPVVSYPYPGIYRVTLFAYGDGRTVSSISVTINVLGNTAALIKVREYYDGYAVRDASVRLYETHDDWLDEEYMVADQYTDGRGEVYIDWLKPRVYYMDIWHESYDNYDLAEEDIEFIQTPLLEHNTVNYFVAYVDYFASKAQKSGGGDMKPKIRQIIKLSKEEYEKIP